MENNNRQGWTRVEDGLPDEHEKVLVLLETDIVLMAIMGANEWAIYWSDGIKGEDTERRITHWMPLPNKPSI